MTGLEPATSGVTGRRSNQLSYTRKAAFQHLGTFRSGSCLASSRSVAVIYQAARGVAIGFSEKKAHLAKKTALPGPDGTCPL